MEGRNDRSMDGKDKVNKMDGIYKMNEDLEVDKG